MEWRGLIEVRSDVLVGKPVVKGTRLAVELILDLLASGCSEQEVLGNYPNLGPEHPRACVAYADEIGREERVYPRGA